jgi:hypothetical protein
MGNPSKFWVIFVAFALLLATGCTKNSPAPATPANIYIAREMGNSGVLWTSGLTSYLPDTAYGPSNALAVFVSGNDVYVSGWGYGGGGFQLATVWVNGVSTSLPSPTTSAFFPLCA